MCTEIKQKQIAADVVIKNANVYIIDADNSVCNSIAFAKGEIICVGSEQDTESYIDKKTKVIDIDGCTVLPGFIDGHIHAGIEQIIQLYCLDLRTIEQSLDSYKKVIAEYISNNQDLDVIFGVGYQYIAFDDGRPNKTFLDELCPDKPVYISDVSLHAIWTNTLGLKSLGIDNTTVAPRGGLIVKDENGDLAGELSDVFSIMEIWIQKGITPNMFLEAFKLLEKDCAAKGITSINSMGTLLSGRELWDLMREHENSGEMTLRVNFAHDHTPEQNIFDLLDLLNKGEEYESDYLSSKTVKLFLDGTPEGKTAYLLEPYSNNPVGSENYRAASLWVSDELNDVVSKVDAAKRQIHIHAIGDAAVKQAIDAIEYAAKENGLRDSRHCIAHICLIEDKDIDRMANLGIYGVVQPIWAYQDHIFSDLEIEAYGQERYEKEYPFRTMCEKGVCLVGSADNPVSENRPLSGIQVAVTRSSPYGDERFDSSFIRSSSEAISVSDAIRAYTINAAKEMFMEDKIGSLEVGKKADMIILDRDLIQIDPREIVETEILATIFNGELVYDKCNWFVD